LFGKTGENFLPNGTAQIFPQKKWNGTSVFHLTGVTLLCERRHVFGQKPRIHPGSMALVGGSKWNIDFPIISVKTRKEEYL